MKIVLFIALGLLVWMGILPAILAIPEDSKFTTYRGRFEFFFYAFTAILILPFTPIILVVYHGFWHLKRKILKYPTVDDFERDGKTYTFTGNPNIICNCLTSGKCEQYPYRNNEENPFIDVKGEKICSRVWKEK